MPEGPEIRRIADELHEVLGATVVRRLFFAFPHLKPFSPHLENRTVLQVQSRGKALLTRFDNGLTLYSHNQLYGRWMITPLDLEPDTGRQLHLALHTDLHSAWLYSASEIEVLDEQQLQRHPFLSRLGPDLLDETFESQQLLARFMDRKFRGRRLGTLLVDQAFVAGLGNYLRCEILHVTGLHPALRPTDCSDRQLEHLAVNSIRLIRQSHQTAGITNDLQRAEALQQQGVEKGDYRFYVFRREGLPCYRCGTSIVKLTGAGQPCYLCPSCQKP
jgi:endonuclease-8